MANTIATQTMVLPEGLDPAQDPHNYSLYALYVRWQNTLGWTVTTHFPEERLSVKGRKWANYVEKRNRRFYYFDSYEAALAAASETVETHTIMGLTWTQHNQRRAQLQESEKRHD